MSDLRQLLSLSVVLLLGICVLPEVGVFAQDLPECGPANEDDGSVRIGCSLTLQSEVLEQERRLNVYVPPAYGKEDVSYPTLYLLDGGVHEDFVHIAGIASLAAGFRKIRPFLVVGIEGIDRYHDLFPPSKVKQDQERLPTAGGSAAFRTFLTSEVVPFVRQTLRTTEETVLLGESAAGRGLLFPSCFDLGRSRCGPSLRAHGRGVSRHHSSSGGS